MQDPSSMTLEQIVYFHDYSTMIMIMVIVVVGYFTIPVLLGKGYPPSIIADHSAESTWTIPPIVVLIFLVHPPTHPPYLIDENSVDLVCTPKVAGHQWYWSHPTDSFLYHEVDSHMDNESAARLMDADNRAMVPPQEYIRASITSNDAPHPWAPPPLGMKMDAIPGRSNQPISMAMIDAVIHGQRSETCGVNHPPMPIAPESISLVEILCQSSFRVSISRIKGFLTMVNVFHVVGLSMWPSLTSVVVSPSSISLSTMMKYGAMSPWVNVFVIALIPVWPKDVMRESDVDVNHGSPSNASSKVGTTSFISSEITPFAPLLRCYLDPASVVDHESGVRPPKGILSISPPSAPSLNTLILPSPGVFITWTHSSISSNNWLTSLVTLTSTPVSGSYLSAIQYMEYGETPHSFTNSGYGSISFSATGFHGFHAILGCSTILVSCVRVSLPKTDEVSHYNFESPAWYWHPADVARLPLYIFTHRWGPLCDLRLMMCWPLLRPP